MALSLVEDNGKHRSACGYCGSARGSVAEGMVVDSMGCDVYQELLDRGWRRSGTFMYRPVLEETCCQLLTIRLEAAAFRPTRKQRRARRRWDAIIAGGRDVGSEEGAVAPPPMTFPVPACPAIAPSATELATQLSAALAAALRACIVARTLPGSERYPAVPPISNARGGGGGTGSASRLSLRSPYAASPLPRIVAGIARKAGAVGPQADPVHVGNLLLVSLVLPPTVEAQTESGFINFFVRCGKEGGVVTRDAAATPAASATLPVGLVPIREGAGAQGGAASAAPPPLLPATSALSPPLPAASALSPPLSAASAAPLPPAPTADRPRGVSPKRPGSTVTPASSAKRWGGGEPAPARQSDANGARSRHPRGPPRPRFRLEILPSDHPGLLEVEFPLYKKYQVRHHGDSPSSVTPLGFKRFLCSSPLVREPVATRPRPDRPRPQAHVPAGASPPPAEDAATVGVRLQAAKHRRPRSRVGDLGAATGGGPPGPGAVTGSGRAGTGAPTGDRLTGAPTARRPAAVSLSATAPPAPPLTLEYGSFHQQYWLDDRLIAVGVVDVLPKCLSSVYTFWDPDFASLSLGRLTSLLEIEWVRACGIPDLEYYYLGYFLETCPRMRYKGEFAPSDLLCPVTGAWVPLERCERALRGATLGEGERDVPDLAPAADAGAVGGGPGLPPGAATPPVASLPEPPEALVSASADSSSETSSADPPSPPAELSPDTATPARRGGGPRRSRPPQPGRTLLLDLSALPGALEGLGPRSNVREPPPLPPLPPPTPAQVDGVRLFIHRGHRAPPAVVPFGRLAALGVLQPATTRDLRARLTRFVAIVGPEAARELVYVVG